MSCGQLAEHWCCVNPFHIRMQERCRHLQGVSHAHGKCCCVRSGNTEVKLSTDAFDSSHEPFLQLFLDCARLSVRVVLVSRRQDARCPGTGKEIDEVYNAILMDIPRLQDCRRRQVLLLCGARGDVRRSDAEISTLVFVEKTAEDGGRIKVRPEKCVNLLLFHGHEDLKAQSCFCLTRQTVRRDGRVGLYRVLPPGLPSRRPQTYQHMKSDAYDGQQSALWDTEYHFIPTLPSILTRAHVRMLPIIP